jgi:hypothetical protein
MGVEKKYLFNYNKLYLILQDQIYLTNSRIFNNFKA